MKSSAKKICTVLFSLLAVILILSALFANLFYLDLKKTFVSGLSERASALIGQRIDIGDISFSLSSGINLINLQVQNPEGFVPGTLLKIKRISLSMHYRELFAGMLHFSDISLYAPELTLMEDHEGKLNISDEFRRFLSRKGTLTYQVDEIRLISGTAVFQNDSRYRGERINLFLKDISSRPGTKTVIAGDALLSGLNSAKIDGWATLRDEPKKFRLSLSADDFSLSPFKEMLSRYHLDLGQTVLKMRFDAEGATDQGVVLQAGVNIISPGYDFYRKGQLDIMVDAVAFYDLSLREAMIRDLTVKAGEDVALRLNGKVKDLPGEAVYQLVGRIDRLDLAAFDVLQGVRIRGGLSSDSIRVKGSFDHPAAEVEGSIRVKDISVNSAGLDLNSMNGRLVFFSGKNQSASADVTADIVKAGGYALSGPAAVRLSLQAKVMQRGVAWSASLNTSPFGVQIGKEKKLFLGDMHALMQGMLKGDALSGKSTVRADRIAYDDYAVHGIKGGFSFSYDKGNVAINNPKVEAEEFFASADMMNIVMTGRRGELSLVAKNLSVSYPVKKASLEGLDFNAKLYTRDKNISGEVAFAAADGMFHAFRSGNVIGKAGFDGKDFSLDVARADIAGGRVSLTAEGKTSQGPFPMKTEITAEYLDLGQLAAFAEKFGESKYKVTGMLEKAFFKGRLDSVESLQGTAELDLRKLSLLNSETKRYLLKNASFQPVITCKGKNCDFQAAVSAGAVAAAVSGTARNVLGEEREVRLLAKVKETLLTEIRNSFWDIFPDSLLYAAMAGSVSSEIRLGYQKGKTSLEGDMGFTDVLLEGENGAYALGPVNGIVPFSYGLFEGGKPMALPSFERSDFDNIRRYYAAPPPGGDYNRITIGSFQYGFRLLKDLTVWIKRDGGILNVARISANIFGGKVNGSGVFDLTNGFHYHAGLILEGLSLTTLCDEIEPIRGYISGKVDGIGLVKGSGADLAEVIGRADFWTYATREEKTKISKEFLQRLGGPSMKAYLGDRNFDKGRMSLYVQKGFIVFRELDISNRNMFGMQDLSVKVAPYSNRIAIDHLLWTVLEAAHRAKKSGK